MRGGTKPTVTDANLQVGLLNPDYFLGGEMEIDPERSRAAIARIADYYGLSVDEAALGIIRIVNTNMAALLQTMTVKRGYDPREFAMVAMGGAGPLHAAAIAQEMNIPTIIVPMNSGVFSAWGMLMADLRHDYAVTHIQPVADLGVDSLNTRFSDLAARLYDVFERENVPKEDVAISFELDLRYLGQEHALTVPAPNPFTEADKAVVAKAFDDLHLATYGHHAPEEPKVMVSLKAIGIGRVQKPDLKTIPAGAVTPPAGAQVGRRPVYRGNGQYEQFGVYRRDKLLAGNQIQGPAVVEETTATTVIESNQVCSVDRWGNLILTRK